MGVSDTRAWRDSGPRLGRPVWQRFWEKVSFGDCWEWQASLSDQGYGYFNAGNKKTVLAHRWAYAYFYDSPALGLDHLCRVRHCVNPAHLEPVTIRENVLRGENNAAQNARKTHCPLGHEYNEVNTRRIGNRRWCRACAVVRRRTARG